MRGQLAGENFILKEQKARALGTKVRSGASELPHLGVLESRGQQLVDRVWMCASGCQRNCKVTVSDEGD